MRLEGQKILGCGGVTSTKNFDQFIESRSTTSQVESTTADKLKVSSLFFFGAREAMFPRGKANAKVGPRHSESR